MKQMGKTTNCRERVWGCRERNGIEWRERGGVGKDGGRERVWTWLSQTQQPFLLPKLASLRFFLTFFFIYKKKTLTYLLKALYYYRLIYLF